MKRISFLMITILLACTMTMAQGNRRGGERKVDPKERAEKMTERMVKEYSLNETQKQQLLDVNLAMAESMKDMPARPHRNGQKGNKSDVKKDAPKNKEARKNTDSEKREKRPDMTKEQREKIHNEMKEARASYDAKVKDIMTPEQFAEYTKKQNERHERMKQRRPQS